MSQRWDALRARKDTLHRSFPQDDQGILCRQPLAALQQYVQFVRKDVRWASRTARVELAVSPGQHLEPAVRPALLFLLVLAGPFVASCDEPREDDEGGLRAPLRMTRRCPMIRYGCLRTTSVTSGTRSAWSSWRGRRRDRGGMGRWSHFEQHAGIRSPGGLRPAGGKAGPGTRGVPWCGRAEAALLSKAGGTPSFSQPWAGESGQTRCPSPWMRFALPAFLRPPRSGASALPHAEGRDLAPHR
jgi:hypothetical protein